MPRLQQLTSTRLKAIRFSLLVIVCCVSSLRSHAQAEVDGPAGYDASDLSIAHVAPSTPRPITSMDLLTIRDIRGMRISPDGKSVAFVLAQAVYESNRYRTALFVIDTRPGSVPTRLGSPGAPRWDDIGTFRPYVLTWSPDSRFIICLMKGNDQWQLWRWKKDGGKPEQLTHNASDIEDYEWSRDGKKIIFFTKDPTGTANSKIFDEGFLYDGSFRLWGRHTFPRLWLESKPPPRETWIYEFDTGIERKATKEEEAAHKQAQTTPKLGPDQFPRGAKMSPDGNQQAFIVTDAESKESIWINPVSGGKPTALTQSTLGFIRDLWWGKDSKQVFFTQFSDDKSTLYVASVNGGAVREVNKDPDFIGSFSLSDDQNLAACSRYNATLPPVVAVLDLNSGTVRTLVDVNPEFKNIRLSPATKLEWKNKFGDRTYGYLVKPLNYEPGKRYPLIVTTYTAGAFLRGAAGDEYPIQVFAANGFAVLDFSTPRQKMVRDGDFKKAMQRYYSPLDSLAEAIRLLDEMGIVDPKFAGLSGLSHGAEITEFAISHSNLFGAAITSGPAGRDPFFYDLAENGFKKIFTEWWGLGKRSDTTAMDRWRELAPALNAEKVKAAFLMNAADSEVLASLMFWNAMKELNKPIEMFIYAGEGHIKNQPKHRYEIYERNLDWFKFWLQAKETSDPAKQKQYERWRAIRDATKKDESTRTLDSK